MERVKCLWGMMNTADEELLQVRNITFYCNSTTVNLVRRNEVECTQSMFTARPVLLFLISFPEISVLSFATYGCQDQDEINSCLQNILTSLKWGWIEAVMGNLLAPHFLPKWLVYHLWIFHAISHVCSFNLHVTNSLTIWCMSLLIYKGVFSQNTLVK